MEPIEEKVWFVTGASNGLGLNLVQNLLNSPNVKVVALTRRPEELEKEIPVEHLPNLLISKSDITNESSVKESIKSAIERFGKIDVVVNNAGYGLAGSVEELSDEEMRKIFDVNFFGVLHVIRNVTPHLRQRRTGVIFNISSICGWLTLPELSAYQTTKHALNGLNFSLQQELEPMGIKVVLISPSGFKSSFVDTGMALAKKTIDEYKTKDRITWLDDIVNNARGDPNKFSQVLIKVSQLEKPAKNYFLGTHAVQFMRNWFKAQTNELESNIETIISTDYPHAPKIEY